MTFSGLFLYLSTTMCQFCFTAQVHRVAAAMYQRHGAFRFWLYILKWRVTRVCLNGILNT